MSTPDAGGFVGTLRETDAIGRYAVAYLRTLAGIIKILKYTKLLA